ncbi:hypothetical protein Fmac_010607 [Flemingia macrophylla]|uniref:Uncharacterized protein n=1 Tax=Flemingia macrophylla TaxID=520843 RepID=A0ABD1MK25_9FABA
MTMLNPCPTLILQCERRLSAKHGVDEVKQSVPCLFGSKKKDIVLFYVCVKNKRKKKKKKSCVVLLDW